MFLFGARENVRVEHLDGDDIARLAVPRAVDAAERALAQEVQESIGPEYEARASTGQTFVGLKACELPAGHQLPGENARRLGRRACLIRQFREKGQVDQPIPPERVDQVSDRADGHDGTSPHEAPPARSRGSPPLEAWPRARARFDRA